MSSQGPGPWNMAVIGQKQNILAKALYFAGRGQSPGMGLGGHLEPPPGFSPGSYCAFSGLCIHLDSGTEVQLGKRVLVSLPCLCLRVIGGGMGGTWCLCCSQEQAPTCLGARLHVIN